MDYKDAIKFYPDFPIKGVNFVDVIPFMQDKELFRSMTRDLGVLCASPNVTAPEARGFLFATPMLTDCPNIRCTIPIRKKGKLPYAFFDDILATGGTAKGIAEDLQKRTVVVDGKEYRIKVTDFVFVVEITDLPGREILEPIAPVKSLIKVTES